MATYTKNLYSPLLSPFFVGATETNDKVFFFFREEAIETSNSEQVNIVMVEIIKQIKLSILPDLNFYKQNIRNLI